MPETYTLTHETVGPALIVRTKGRFDRDTGQAILTLLDERDGAGPCVINLAEVDYISSSGVAALVKMRAKHELRIASPAECVSDVLSLAGVADRILAIHATEEAALES